MTATFTTGELIITLVSVATLAGIFGFWAGARYWRQFERDHIEREKRDAKLDAKLNESISEMDQMIQEAKERVKQSRTKYFAAINN